MYQAVDGAMLRAAVGTPAIAPWPDLSGELPPDSGAWRRWLAEAWSDAAVADAVSVASPALAARVDAALEGQITSARQLRRTGESVVRYLLRMNGRPTPFGLFAGVAPARFGGSLSLAWPGPARTAQWRGRMPAGWPPWPTGSRRTTICSTG